MFYMKIIGYCSRNCLTIFNWKTYQYNIYLKYSPSSYSGVLDDMDDEEKGKSLFYHDTSRSSNYYYDANFQPEYETDLLLSENAWVEHEQLLL